MRSDASWAWFGVKFLVTLAYCFVHTFMHLVRVLIVNVAMNSSPPRRAVQHTEV